MGINRLKLVAVEGRYDMPLFRACLHGGGGPLESEVTRLGGITRLSI